MSSAASKRLQYLIKHQRGKTSAIMLTGPWGSGKTKACLELIKEVRSHNAPGMCGGTKVVLVSLFGVSTHTELSNLILSAYHRQHSFLHRFFLLGAREIAITIVRKITGRANSNIELALNNIAGHENIVLIFDDIERASLPAVQLLGYINRFVTISPCQVVLVCEDSSYIGRDDADAEVRKTYLEKVCGPRVHVSSKNQRDIVKGLCDQFSHEISQDHLQLVKNAMISIFEQGGFGNLRLLLNGFNGLRDLLSDLPDVSIVNYEVQSAIVEQYLIMSIEYQKGNVGREDLPKMHEDRGFLFMNPGEAKEHPRHLQAMQKYRFYVRSASDIPIDQVIKYVTGEIDPSYDNRAHMKNAIKWMCIPYQRVFQKIETQLPEFLEHAKQTAEDDAFLRPCHGSSPGANFYDAVGFLYRWKWYTREVVSREDLELLVRSKILDCVKPHILEGIVEATHPKPLPIQKNLHQVALLRLQNLAQHEHEFITSGEGITNDRDMRAFNIAAENITEGIGSISYLHLPDRFAKSCPKYRPSIANAIGGIITWSYNNDERVFEEIMEASKLTFQSLKLHQDMDQSTRASMHQIARYHRSALHKQQSQKSICP